MIKNAVFDFGMVLVKFDPEYMTSRYTRDKEDIKLVSQVLFDRLYWDRLDAGTISDEQVINESCKRLPERLHEVAAKVYTNWMYNLPEIEGMRSLVEKLKNRGVRLFLLSNISRGFAAKSGEFSILSYFEKCVFSAECGYVKPSVEIFNYLLTQGGILASETIFIDDSEKNIKGAQNAGLEAYLFDGDAGRLEAYFKEKGIL